MTKAEEDRIKSSIIALQALLTKETEVKPKLQDRKADHQKDIQTWWKKKYPLS